MSVVTQHVEWDKKLISRYDLAGPRYTSYPTAPQFQESFTDVALLNAIARSNQAQRPLSLYFHIPFCDSLCYYCGCNKVISRDQSKADRYLQALAREIQFYHAVTRDKQVSQLHLGGGTPTFLDQQQLTQLRLAYNKQPDMLRLLEKDLFERWMELYQLQPPTEELSTQ